MSKGYQYEVRSVCQQALPYRLLHSPRRFIQLIILPQIQALVYYKRFDQRPKQFLRYDG